MKGVSTIKLGSPLVNSTTGNISTNKAPQSYTIESFVVKNNTSSIQYSIDLFRVDHTLFNFIKATIVGFQPHPELVVGNFYYNYSTNIIHYTTSWQEIPTPFSSTVHLIEYINSTVFEEESSLIQDSYTDGTNTSFSQYSFEFAPFPSLDGDFLVYKANEIRPYGTVKILLELL